MGVFLALVATGAPTHLTADVVIVETTVANGKSKVDGVRNTRIKGAGATTIRLEAKRKRAELRDIGARNAQLERLYPRERTVVSLTGTGARKEPTLNVGPCRV